jgi:hypothetical protein
LFLVILVLYGSVMQQMSHELEQKRFGVCRLRSPSNPSSTCFGMKIDF